MLNSPLFKIDSTGNNGVGFSSEVLRYELSSLYGSSFHRLSPASGVQQMGWLAQVVRVFSHAEAALALIQNPTTAPLATRPLIFHDEFLC